jgi:hypothetical protein
MKTFQDNQRKPCSLPTDRQTDGPTGRQTDISKTIYPLFFEGGHKNLSEKLQLEQDLTLEKCVTMARISELVKNQIRSQQA